MLVQRGVWSVFLTSFDNVSFFIDVESQFMPWLMEEVTVELNKARLARAVLDSKFVVLIFFALRFAFVI